MANFTIGSNDFRRGLIKDSSSFRRYTVVFADFGPPGDDFLISQVIEDAASIMLVQWQRAVY